MFKCDRSQRLSCRVYRWSHCPNSERKCKAKRLKWQEWKKKKVFLTTRAAKRESIDLGNTETSGHWAKAGRPTASMQEDFSTGRETRRGLWSPFQWKVYEVLIPLLQTKCLGGFFLLLVHLANKSKGWMRFALWLLDVDL